MKSIVLTAGAVLLAAVPVSMGLVGNTSFAQSVPVRVPAQAVVVDDNSGQRAVDDPEPSDDNSGKSDANTPEPGDINPERGNDNAVEPDENRGTSSHIEPRDDNTPEPSDASTPEPSEDNSGNSTQSGLGGDKVSDSGSGSDDSAADTSGKGGSNDGSGHP